MGISTSNYVRLPRNCVLDGPKYIIMTLDLLFVDDGQPTCPIHVQYVDVLFSGNLKIPGKLHLVGYIPTGSIYCIFTYIYHKTTWILWDWRVLHLKQQVIFWGLSLLTFLVILEQRLA